jgi:hypothetical protein
MAGSSSAKTRGACHRAALCADPLALLPGHDGRAIRVVARDTELTPAPCKKLMRSATVHLDAFKLSPHHSPCTKRKMSWNAVTFLNLLLE